MTTILSRGSWMKCQVECRIQQFQMNCQMFADLKTLYKNAYVLAIAISRALRHAQLPIINPPLDFVRFRQPFKHIESESKCYSTSTLKPSGFQHRCCFQCVFITPASRSIAHYQSTLGFRAISSAILTHRGQDKMEAISHTTLSNAFYWMEMFELWLRFHWNMFLEIELTII